MKPKYLPQDDADLSPGLSAGEAHVFPSASIVRGGLLGLTMIETAILLAAGYVLLNKRGRVRSYLDRNGMNIEELFHEARKYFKLDEGHPLRH